MSAFNSTRQVYFDEFATLVYTITRVTKNNSKASIERLFQEFVTRIKGQGPFSPETGPILFRLLFPEEDGNRKYGLQEAALSKVLVKYLSNLGVGEAYMASIKDWAGRTNNVRPGRVGCLGEELKGIIQSRNLASQRGRPTLEDVDRLLDELARLCRFSQLPSKPDSPESRSQLAILTELYNSVTADGAAVVTQIILKDLRPILHALEIIHTTSNLLKQKAPSNQLTIIAALKIWDPNLPRVYRVCSTIQEAFRIIEDGIPPTLEPVIGVPVQIPKCYKGRSCKDALKPLATAKRVYCETKYDGERMQIHIDLTLPTRRQITIFSKSKRDSTLDRYATHAIIRASLGMDEPSYEQPFLDARVKEDPDFEQRFTTSIILEAEMVAYSERMKSIDEFWRIRDLIAATAKGIRGKQNRMANEHIKGRSSSPDTNYRDSDDESSYESSDPSPVAFSLESNGTDDGNRHFMVVFFDVLSIDGRNLLQEPYSIRRALLEDTIREIEGFSKLAARTPLDMSKANVERTLQAILASSSSQFEEGLVLKADSSPYNSAKLPWVKLKRDYIPGLGDCVDMAVVGATWDQERARELGVGTDTFTTFYVAALPDVPIAGNPEVIMTCLFTVSYGISRKELEGLNFEIKARSPGLWRNRDPIPYTVALCPGLGPPSVLFHTPLLFEVFGAGFDKPPRSQYYALRWPRVSKIYRAEERRWTTGETLASFTAKAYKAVGRDSTKKRIGIQVSAMWQATPDESPEARSFVKRRAIEKDILKKLRGDAPEPTKKAPAKEFHSSENGDHLRGGATGALPVNGFPNAVPDALDLLGELDDAEGYPSDSSRSPQKRKRVDEPPSNSQEPSKKRRIENISTQEEEQVIEDFVALGVEAAKGSTAVPPAPTKRLVMVFPPHPPIVPNQPPTLPSLLKDTFSVVIRPLYPIPKRPKGRPALKTIFPEGSLLSTLDALLVGVEWTPRTYPFWRRIVRGLVFVDEKDKADIIGRLEKRKKELMAEEKSATEIYVISRTYLDIYIDSGLKETVVEPLWHSHPYLRRSRTSA